MARGIVHPKSQNDNFTAPGKSRIRIIRLYGIVLALISSGIFRVDCYTSTARGAAARTTTTAIESRLFMDDVGNQERETKYLIESNPTCTGRENTESVDHSRRYALQSLLMASVAIPSLPALAGKPEVDSSGILYSPKNEMLSGGSEAARGISLENSAPKPKLQPGQALQTIYETRFIAYLSRFLLNFDPTVKAWWEQNVGTAAGNNSTTDKDTRAMMETKFAEFAESVEIGLADYFVGPYGSYSSLSAMKAGVDAKMPAKSARPDDPTGFFGTIKENVFTQKKKKELLEKDRDRVSKQGILNLYTLLKARYSTTTAKRQLAILFSFFSNPDLQPTTEISSLLGEADNARVAEIGLIKPVIDFEATSRTSSRRGGGYSLTDMPTVTVEGPPALGSSYRMATAEPIMKPTSRVLRIKVTDGGEGYTMPPEVSIKSNAQRQCVASAILDREGHVDSVLVLDPGYGYGNGKLHQPPKVVIAPPNAKTENGKKNNSRRATAVAELEYQIIAVETTAKGNGYVSSRPPEVTISPPLEDPDWFVDSPELAIAQSKFGPIRAQVSQMQGPNGILEIFSLGEARPRLKLNLDVIRKDPLELLPSSVRPEINSYGVYVIPPIAAIATYSSSPNPRYRAVDPLFGAIGKVPVTKSAMELKPSEYGRLALSGAVCTVLVRTALNPLELIKTKQQLQNDEELLSFARDKVMKTAAATMNSTLSLTDKDMEPDETELKIGTGDLISSVVELRGPLALFQSADITFLASLMFGSFGFGATELFRRSFSGIFFSEGGGTGLESELVLLLAAAVATIITSAAAAPFELLRVRSMGLIESKGWTEVLGDFIKEKSVNGYHATTSIKSHAKGMKEESKFRLNDVNPRDLLPLFAGFAPTASRELAFAIPKFLAFDILAKAITGFINAQERPGSLPVQVGVGSAGLLISAIAGAIAGLAGAVVSHPADLILTYTSASQKKTSDSGDAGVDWKDVVKDLLSREGGIANLFVGLTPRLVFFFLVIGLQFFLYDYVKNILEVGSEDLSLVLDVFYAVRRGLVEITDSTM